MASGEARATWQRMANRCFLQEDATRTPKLACSSLSRPQYDTNGRGIDGIGQSTSNFVPSAWNQVNSDVLPQDTKWWLQFEMNSTYLKDSHKQPNAISEELQGKTVENIIRSPTCKSDSIPVSKYDFDIEGNIPFSVPPPQMVSTAFMKHDYRKVEELKAVKSDFQQSLMCKTDLDEYLFEDELVDRKSIEQLMSEKLVEDYFAMEPEWKGAKKTEPWWQIADKDDLTLLIAQRSLCQVENCDLPRPQKVYVSTDPPPYRKNHNDNRTPSENSEQSGCCGILNRTDFVLRRSTSCSMDEHLLPSSKVHLSGNVEKCHNHTPVPTTNNSREYEDDRNKAQLLKALCHSQTRARKAEIAAQKAQNEKEHIVKLFFRQASHMFAYKQWLQLLQLESLCLQMKIRENQISSLLPDMPWVSLKWPEMSRANHDVSAKKGKKEKRKCSTCRYLFAFAIGFSLASAGLLLGMTLGWLPVVL